MMAEGLFRLAVNAPLMAGVMVTMLLGGAVGLWYFGSESGKHGR
jgi:hypothetical protein